MTNLPAEDTRATNATRPRQLTRVLAVGAFAAGAAVTMVVPAQAASAPVANAASFTYHVAGSRGARVLADPHTAGAATITNLAGGTTVTIDCGVQGRNVRGDSVWHHITSPIPGYIADYYTDTPGFNQFIRGEATCSTTTTPSTPATTPTTPGTTAPPAPSAARGATIDYNEGYAGSCVYYVMNRFHQLLGVYPKAFGDAKYLAGSAADNGWTVGTAPRINSLAVFQPGQNGAGAPTGHAAWVEQISGDRIYVAEMNAPNPWEITHRWLTPVAGVHYIYTS